MTNLNPRFIMLGSSEKIGGVKDRLQTAAATDFTVLLTGETGVGKELAARYIHDKSNRQGHSFVPFSCSVLTPDLSASQLFGYEKGAFTGAYTDKIGLIERADKGTLFLDDVGTLNPGAQAQLLRVLEDGVVEKLTAKRGRRVEVRVIAGTNQELSKHPSFREDLYYRINVVSINIPSLRERPDDIEEIAQFYMERLNAMNGIKRALDIGALNTLKRYEFPGNVRELVNVLTRAYIFSPAEAIDDCTIAQAIRDANPTYVAEPFATEPPQQENGFRINARFPWDRKAAEKQFYELMVKAAFNAQDTAVGAAKRLKMPYSTLGDMIQQLGYESTKDFRAAHGIYYVHGKQRGDTYDAQPDAVDSASLIDELAHTGMHESQGSPPLDTKTINPQNPQARAYVDRWAEALRTCGGSVREAGRLIDEPTQKLYNNLKPAGYKNMPEFRVAKGITSDPYRSLGSKA